MCYIVSTISEYKLYSLSGGRRVDGDEGSTTCGGSITGTWCDEMYDAFPAIKAVNPDP
ncbi:hypothetical protein A2U01_0055612, partial [Trifolium medium]|nr:hypothetical protein [Trifolium medium]